MHELLSRKDPRFLAWREPLNRRLIDWFSACYDRCTTCTTSACACIISSKLSEMACWSGGVLLINKSTSSCDWGCFAKALAFHRFRVASGCTCLRLLLPESPKRKVIIGAS